MQDIIEKIKWDSIDWSDWVAIVVATTAAVWSWRSAKSSEKQNELSLYRHKVDAYDKFVTEFWEGVYLDGGEVSERIKNRNNFTQSCMLIRFLFKPSIYVITDNMNVKFQEFNKLNDDIFILTDEIEDPPLGTASSRIESLKKERQNLRSELKDERKAIVISFTKCKALLENEITLYKPPQLTAMTLLFLPLTVIWLWRVMIHNLEIWKSRMK